MRLRPDGEPLQVLVMFVGAYTARGPYTEQSALTLRLVDMARRCTSRYWVNLGIQKCR